MAEHSMCQPGRPRPHGLGQDGSPWLGALPEREITRIALAWLELLARAPRAGCSGRGWLSLPYAGNVSHVEVDVAARPGRRDPRSTSPAMNSTMRSMSR